MAGGASCVWQDLDNAHALLWRAKIDPEDIVYIAVNEVGEGLPRVDHWVSLHADRLPSWTEAREGEVTWETWTNNDPYEIADHTLKHPGGSSGGFAVAVALEIGADRVILCGCPLESRFTHYFQTPDGETQPFDEAGRFREEWVENGLIERWADVVRSCSGWTQRKMGSPTVPWLKMRGAA